MRDKLAVSGMKGQAHPTISADDSLCCTYFRQVLRRTRSFGQTRQLSRARDGYDHQGYHLVLLYFETSRDTAFHGYEQVHRPYKLHSTGGGLLEQSGTTGSRKISEHLIHASTL